eukprot:snap_masked-scaffold_3-processed-gene-1.0-mRNA-1 protein AED:1.00 eAED:1.00 QI:0/0/0/0/1/1/2/0/96
MAKWRFFLDNKKHDVKAFAAAMVMLTQGDYKPGLGEYNFFYNLARGMKSLYEIVPKIPWSHYKPTRCHKNFQLNDIDNSDEELPEATTMPRTEEGL